MESPNAFGREQGGVEEVSSVKRGELAQPPMILKRRATVDSVDQRHNKMVVNDSLMDIPPGTPYLRPGDKIEMQFDKKSGKILKIIRVGVNENRHHPFSHGDDSNRSRSAFKGNHGQIRKVDGKWQNY